MPMEPRLPPRPNLPEVASLSDDELRAEQAKWPGFLQAIPEPLRVGQEWWIKQRIYELKREAERR
jgi:hypothetical protein